MKSFNIIVILMFLNNLIYSQEIRFTYSVADLGATSVVTVSAFKVDNMPTNENMSSFNFGFFFKSNEAQINGLTAGATSVSLNSTQLASSIDGTLAGWSPDLTGSIIMVTNTFDGNTYDRLFTGGITDGNFLGSDIGTTPVPMLTLTFNNSPGTANFGDFIYMGATDTNSGWEYSNTSFQGFPIVTQTQRTQALPIDIKTFSATKDGDRNARLNWSTSLEINSVYFGVERSKDGNTWEALDKVRAAGNSTTDQLYTYTDRDLPLNRSEDQIFYYRLQLVDLDGKYKYSEIRGVNFGKADSDKMIILYPNPAVQMVNLDISGMDLNAGAIHLKVSDMQGRTMIDKTIQGNGIEPIDVTQLPVGTYNVAVTQGTTLHQKQFIKID